MSIYTGSSEISKVYIGSTEAKEVYVWSTKVRPAWWEYSYNFIGKTISQIANDWWQGTSWWTNTSDGIYRNSWSNPLSISPSWLGTALSNAKKVTMNIGAYITKWTWVRDLACRVTNQWQTASKNRFNEWIIRCNHFFP